MKDKALLRQHNALTQSRHNFTVIEKRCLYKIIAELRHRYEEGSATRNGGFDNMYLELNASEFAPHADKLKDVYSALRSLSNKEIEIENEDYWITTRWILQAKHDKARNVFCIDVSRDIMPYLVELVNEYTTYDLVVAIGLKSVYSQRFYEYCCQYSNHNNRFCFTIERLREILKLETKYRLNTDFRKSVIDVAQKEIKDLYERGGCDLWFDCDVSKKEGKRVLEYTFTIHGSRTKKIDSFDYQNTQSLINAINRSLKDIFPKDAKYIKSVIKEVHLRPDIAPVILRKINRIISGYPPFQVPGVLRYALKEDYQIK